MPGVCVRPLGLGPAGDAHAGFRMVRGRAGLLLPKATHRSLGTRLPRGCHGAGAVGFLSSPPAPGAGATLWPQVPGAQGVALGQARTRDVLGPRSVRQDVFSVSVFPDLSFSYIDCISLVLPLPQLPVMLSSRHPHPGSPVPSRL